MDELTTGAGVFDRREALKRGGFVVGAAALWATPVVQTIGMRPAAGTEVGSDFCPEDLKSGQPPSLVWQYTGRSCAQSDTGQDWNPGVKCSETLIPFPDTVDIRLIRTGIGGGNPDTWVRGIDKGGYFEIEPVGANITFEIRVPTSVGDTTGAVLQTVADVHTSCSQPLDVGDHFGGVMLAGGSHPDVTQDPNWATTDNTYAPGNDKAWDSSLDD